ncbi:hypothetical protein ACH5RR_013120, partial [Cinchona calisaya]
MASKTRTHQILGLIKFDQGYSDFEAENYRFSGKFWYESDCETGYRDACDVVRADFQ